MKYALLLVATLVLQLPTQAQQKELTLEESVLLNYSKYYPFPQSGLSFLPSGTSYVYQKTDDKNQSVFIKGSCANGSEKTWFTLADVNKWAAGSIAELKRMPRFTWMNDDQAIFQTSGYEYYLLDTKQKAVSSYMNLPETAEEITFNPQFTACVFIDNFNLFVWQKNGRTLQLTMDGSSDLVYGKAVHRNEFGINNGIFWSEDGKHFAFYKMDQSMVGEYPLVHINEQPAKLEMIRYPMAGTASHHVSLVLADVDANANLRYIKPEGDPEQYLTAVTWSPDANMVYIGVLNRDQNHLKMCAYNASTASLSNIVFEEKSTTYVEPEKPFWFNPSDANQKVWFSERSGHQHLYLYADQTSEGSELTPGLFEVQEILGFESSSNTLIFQGTGMVKKDGPKTDDTRNGTQTYTYIQTQGKDDIGRMLDDRIGTHHAMVSKDGKYIIEHFSSIDVPLETSLFDINGKKIKTLHTVSNPLAELKIGTVELIKLNASNGDALYGRIVKPSNFDASKKYPVLIYVYGGPHAQLVQNTYNAAAPLWMNWFAEQGYIVATVDNRGSSNRGQAFEEQTFRKLGTVEMDDQFRLVEYLREQPWADTEHMAVHGWSFGGFMTMNLLLSFPETFKCGVAGGPVCDWSLYEVMYTERYMDTPQTNEEGFKNANLVSRASELKDDLLIIHGTIDDVVVWQHSQSFLKACVDSGVQVDYFVYPEHQHNVRGKDRAHLMVKVLTYIQEHIGE